MWLTDPSTKEPSVTVTLFTLGFVVATLKLLTSGIVIASIHLGTFTGSDFALVVGAVGSIYWGRKHTDAITKDKE